MGLYQHYLLFYSIIWLVQLRGQTYGFYLFLFYFFQSIRLLTYPLVPDSSRRGIDIMTQVRNLVFHIHLIGM